MEDSKPSKSHSNFSLEMINDETKMLNYQYFKLNYDNLENYTDLELLIKELDRLNKKTEEIYDKEIDRYYSLLPHQSKEGKLKQPTIGDRIFFDNQKYKKYLINSNLLIIKNGFVKHDINGYYNIFS
jgi:hypothetical protein